MNSIRISSRAVLEGGVCRIGVLPLNQDSVARVGIVRAGRLVRGRSRVGGRVAEPGMARSVGPPPRVAVVGIDLDVHRVELAEMQAAAVAVVGIELKGDEAIGVTRRARERAKQTGGAGRFDGVAVKIEIRRELPRGFVEEVELAVEVADEKAVQPAARLLAEEIHPRHIPRVVRAVDQFAGLRNGSIVGELKRDRTLGDQRERRNERAEEEPEGATHRRFIQKQNYVSGSVAKRAEAPRRSFHLTA